MLGRFQFLPFPLKGSFLKAGDFLTKGLFIWYFPTLTNEPLTKKNIKKFKEFIEKSIDLQVFSMVLHFHR